jgi:hypothetical protein
MYTNIEYQLDRLEIANNILVRLEMEYKYAVNKNVDKTEMVRFLADQLDRLSDKAVLSWNEALNNISDKAEKHPPAIPEIIDEMRRIEISILPKAKRLEREVIPYASLWNGSSDKDKLTFYDRYNVQEVSAATRWVSKEYFRKAGWGEDKIKKVLG